MCLSFAVQMAKSTLNSIAEQHEGILRNRRSLSWIPISVAFLCGWERKHWPMFALHHVLHVTSWISNTGRLVDRVSGWQNELNLWRQTALLCLQMTSTSSGTTAWKVKYNQQKLASRLPQRVHVCVYTIGQPYKKNPWCLCTRLGLKWSMSGR